MRRDFFDEQATFFCFVEYILRYQESVVLSNEILLGGFLVIMFSVS